MHKKLAGPLVAIALVVSPLFVSAQTTTDKSALIAQLTALVKVLTQELQLLRAMHASTTPAIAITTNSGSTGSATTSSGALSSAAATSSVAGYASNGLTTGASKTASSASASVQSGTVMSAASASGSVNNSAIPLMRYHTNSGVGGSTDWLLTTNPASEYLNGWSYDKVIGSIYPNQASGTVPLYRLYNSVIGDHLYTTNGAEIQTAQTKNGYTSEGVIGYLYPGSASSSLPSGSSAFAIYRAYVPASKQHFYTDTQNEFNYLPTPYSTEGIVGYAMPSTQCVFQGQIIQNGQSVTAYAASKVAYGQQCASQTRTCSNGTLSGTYANASCGVSGPTNAFQILVDVNQLNADPAYPNEAAQASQYAGDGVYAIEENSPCGLQDPGGTCLNWTQTLNALNAGSWAMSEDIASYNGGPVNDDWLNVGSTSQAIGRLVDAAMIYNEDGMGTPLTDAQIADYASRLVPGFGPLGARIFIHTRSYADGDPRQAEFNHALQNPNVSGGGFEVAPNASIIPELKLAQGCKYALSLGKKCYFLLPPGNNDGTEGLYTDTTNFLGDVQQFIQYLAESGGILNNPNTYIVLASYLRPGTIHYTGTDPDSIQSVVAWLKSYRANPPSVSPMPVDKGQKPRGWLDTANCTQQVSGWSQDQDTPGWPTLVHFYIDGTLAGPAYANHYRSDLCSIIGTCNHGFTWSIPAAYRDGKQHTIHAYGIDTTIGNNNSELSGSPKTFQCSQ